MCHPRRETQPRPRGVVEQRRPAVLTGRRPGTVRGFTLIELLVVVAIIALLIAMLLPSLNRARAQARTTQCATRIYQLCLAVLMYADDYGETLPFLGRGWEDADDPGQDPRVWPKFAGATTTVGDWKRYENWLMPNMPDYWLLPQADWPDHAEVRNGSLFSYTRFESLYRCPEFERIADPRKSQNAFNYTRTKLGRKWYHKNDPEAQPGSPWYIGNWAGNAGPVIRTNQVYAPSQLHMLFGERWDRHCAAAPQDFSPPAPCGQGLLEGEIYGTWMAADPMLGMIGNELGQYHAPKVPSEIAIPELREQMPPIKRSSVAFFDGHAGLEADPMPDRNADPEYGINAIQLLVYFMEWTKGHIFAQRGPTDIEIDSPL